ncbi:hypothetical protein [Arthrobacter sp.]|uniref:hypothetical protein n=1 Tax=Arthrobacter sp. TaxID=1667 RepID=UPI003397AE45
MLHPEALLMWDRAGESFSPVLVDVTLLTEVEIGVPLARDGEPGLVPITDWIRPNY